MAEVSGAFTGQMQERSKALSRIDEQTQGLLNHEPGQDPHEIAEHLRSLILRSSELGRLDDNNALMSRNLIYHRTEHFKEILCSMFAQERGWRRAKKRFTPRTLSRRTVHTAYQPGDKWPHQHCDHRYFFRVERRAVGMAAHLYNNREEDRAAAAEWAGSVELQAEFPNFPSWWFPGSTMLVVYTPLDARV